MITPEQLAASGTEHGEQTAFFAWAAQQCAAWRLNTHRPGCMTDQALAAKLMLAFAIPNGGERHIAVAGRLSAEGVKAGVPDIFLPVAMPISIIPTKHGGGEIYAHGLFIEMKRPSEKPIRGGAGGVKAVQRSWHDALRSQGYQVAVCYSWIEARDTVLQYLGVS